jgi:DNA-binding GntR family transcriptional regulator
MPLELTNVPDLGAAPTTSEIVLRHLREAIVTGDLAEGTPIRQDDVARMFNVSKIPVREALKQLAAEGFVTFHRNRGAMVASLSEPEIVQVFEIRALLEAQAIRFAVPLMTAEDLALAEQAEAAFAHETDVSQWAARNWAFHSSLYTPAARDLLLNMILSVNDRVARFLRVQLTVSGGHDLAAREHRRILDACRNGQAEVAAILTHEHIMGACQSLYHHLPHRK